MAFKSVITNDAKADIREAIDWYNNEQKGLGKRFLDSLDKKLNSICITPGIGCIRYDKVRCTMVQIFPYIIHYVVEHHKKKIIVLRVLHAFRKPIH